MPSASRTEPLAIVGIGCRFPGKITSPESYWRRLCEGFDAIGPVPRSRWDSRLHYGSDLSVPGRIIFNAGGFVEQDLYELDARFFGITAREAAVLDPQQRLLLEVAWECLEDALAVPASLEGSATGVFIGAFGIDQGLIQQGYLNLGELDAHAATGATPTMLAARLAHAFDLRGPCVSMDTACSASLVAFHYACQAIWNGECDRALTGGANVMLSPTAAIPPSKGHFFSPSSRSKAFDESADGYGRGEGAGIVLLKRLSDAVADGDRIYALVTATGVNHDGRTQGVSLPNGAAQAALLRRVHAAAGNEPVQYIEAHGTGTALGDPTELQALSDGLGLASAAPVYVGSVKSNIGHLEAAAGVAGLIKASLALYHQQIPPHIGMKKPNPKIAFAELGVRVPTTLVPWPEHTGPARAGVNSFGYGGTNAHAVLQGAPVAAAADSRQAQVSPTIFPLSARDPRALAAVAERLLGYVRERGSALDLSDLVHTQVRHRSHHHQRLAVVATSADELERHLAGFVERSAGAGIARGEAPYGAAPPLVFVYTGMGPQTYGMGAELSRRFEAFARPFYACLDAFSALSGRQLKSELEAAPRASDTPPTALAQWLNFALQHGLFELWKSLGVESDVLLGHSVGEVPAALAAGALSFEDATLVAYHRGRLQQECEGLGGMLAVELDEAGLTELGAAAQDCEIAAFNAPTSITLAGPVKSLTRLQERLDERGVFSRLLKVKVPYHSRAMDRVREPLLEALASIQPKAPQRTLISTVTGDTAGLRDAAYWWRNVREPVQFARAVAAIPGESAPVVLQLGPHAVLTPALKSCFAARLQSPAVLHSLHRERPEPEALLEALAGLYCSGAKLEWDKLAPRGRRVFDLPAYPWQRERHWHESVESLTARCGPTGHVLLQAPVASAQPVWQTELTEGYFAFLQDHRAEDRALFPASGFLEIALAVSQATRGHARARLENFSFYSTLLLDASMKERIEIRFDPTSNALAVAHRTDAARGAWPLLCSGTLTSHQPSPGPNGSLEQALVGHTRIETPLYLERTQSYFYYGPRFRSIEHLHHRGEGFIAELTLPPDANPAGDQYLVHPALLDGAFQSAVLMAQQVLTRGDTDGIVVPISLDRLDFFASPGDGGWCRGRLREYTSRSLEVDLELFAADGQLCVKIEGLRWGFVRTRHEPTAEEVRALLHVAKAVPVEAAGESRPAGRWLVIAPERTAARELESALTALGNSVQLATFTEPLEPQLEQELAGVVLLAPARAEVSEAGTSDWVWKLLSVSQALASSSAQSARFSLVTLGAASADAEGESCADPQLAALWGAARAIGNERGTAELMLADLGATPPASDWPLLAQHLMRTAPERQLSIRDGKSRAIRLEPAPSTQPSGADAPVQRVPTSESVVLSQRGGQRIENLRWEARPRRAPSADEVELQVSGSAINFKDLMKVTGLISDAVTRGTFLGEELGMECAGVVTRVGAGVTTWKPGDRAVAITAGSFASYVTCPAVALVPALPDVSLEQSAAYATFATIVQALERLGQLDAGETILIHSAAGALGLAAIQFAKWRGARVFATASSERKREYLLSLGVEAVADSRSLGFADEVRAWSSGRGVDVVLNFLAGEARLQSLALLASGGRFIEVGKPGGAREAQFPARLFNTNMTFANVDLDQLMRDTPHKMRGLAERVVELFRLGCFQPLPTQVFPPDQAQAAFQLMARSEQIGKVVLGFDGQSVDLSQATGSALRGDRTYLITGAFGGFGLAVSRWLVARGARTLVTLSRTGASGAEAERASKELEALGATLHVRRGDVGDQATVSRLIEEIQRELPPLAGVIHSAMVLDDGLFTAMTPERVSKVMHPKAGGAWALHQATQGISLDFFVLFSSVAGLTGGVGQSNYAAANAFLDGVASYRRGQGLAGTSISWGVLSESGVVARSPQLMRLLADQGVLGIGDQEALAALDVIVSSSFTTVACIKLDAERLGSITNADGGSPFLSDLLQSAKPAEQRIPKGLTELIALLAEHRENPLEVTEGAVAALVAGVLRTSVERVELRRPLSVAGVDSLMATELSVALAREYGIRFTVLDLLRTLSVADVAKSVLDRARAAQAS